MSINKFSVIFIIFLTLFSLALRAYRLTEPNHYYFDEVYHAVTAKGYADNNREAYNPFAAPPKEGTAYDWLHPPLAKLIQAGSIKIFGDVPLGWRLPSLIFGTAIIPATFILANILFGPLVAIFASTIIASENLTFVMSRITMNDVFLAFFVVTSFIFAALYVRSSTSEKMRTKYLVLNGIFLGLALSSKWPGLYTIAAVFVYLLWDQIRNKRIDLKVFIPIIILPPILYLASYGQFWLQGHSVKQFIDLHKQIWGYQQTRNLKHSYGTTPLYCVPEGLDGPKTWCPWILDIRGVYFSYEQYAAPATPPPDSLSNSKRAGERSDGGQGAKAGYIYALGNPLIFWAGIVAVSYLIGKFIEDKSKLQALVILGYFIFWIPWIFSPRILFLYHYLPSLPFLAIATGFALKNIYVSKLKYLALVILLIFIIAFFYFYPITSGLPIKPEDIDKYMWFSTWR